MASANLVAVVVIILIVLFIGGLISDNGNNVTIENDPGVDLTITANNPVIINNNRYSDDTITVKVSKTKNSFPTKYIVEYEPSNPDYLYIVESETYAKKEKWVTEPLTNSGSFKIDQIKIYGKTMIGQDYSPWTVKVNLLYENNSLIMSSIINVNVTTVVE